MKFPDNIAVYGVVDYRGECPREYFEQKAFFKRIRMRYPETWGKIALHPKNEGKREFRKANAEKAEGLTAGASDIIVPGDPTFVCEIKRQDHTQSKWQPNQLEYLHAAQKAGAWVCIALGADAAINAFEDYLGDCYKAE
jgi:hypothetical protein